jgi:hypothetical protein
MEFDLNLVSFGIVVPDIACLSLLFSELERIEYYSQSFLCYRKPMLHSTPLNCSCSGEI